MAGVLLVPEWPTADFWAELMDSQRTAMWPFHKVEICKPFIIQDEFDPKSPFRGRTKFNFLALSFRT